MAKIATVKFEELDPGTRAQLVRATSAFIGKCFSDPHHRRRLAAYKRKLIREGRWPLPGMTDL